MKLIQTTGVTSIPHSVKHPTCHHSYNIRHGILTPPRDTNFTTFKKICKFTIVVIY